MEGCNGLWRVVMAWGRCYYSTKGKNGAEAKHGPRGDPGNYGAPGRIGKFGRPGETGGG